MESSKKPQQRVSGERRRINIKLDEALATFAFEYAERNRTTVTQLITNYFISLQRQEEEKLAYDAEQI